MEQITDMFAIYTAVVAPNSYVLTVWSLVYIQILLLIHSAGLLTRYITFDFVLMVQAQPYQYRRKYGRKAAVSQVRGI